MSQTLARCMTAAAALSSPWARTRQVAAGSLGMRLIGEHAAAWLCTIVLGCQVRLAEGGRASWQPASRQDKATTGMCMTSTPGPTMQVVPGWELAVLGADGVPPIKEGGIRTVRIPPELAYGEGELRPGARLSSGMPS